MREASIANHPIHPMLIVFPIGLWIFSLIADLIFLAGGKPVWTDIAFYSMLGGLIGALAAAIPGLIDFFTITDRQVKKIGLYHMILNLAVVALYAVNLFLRSGAASPDVLPVILSIIAVALLALSGWLGGELVYVHGMGVKAAADTEEKDEPVKLRRYRA